MTTAKSAQNGSKATASKKTPQNPELSKTVVPARAEQKTLEDRLQHVSEIKALIEKRDVVVKKRNEIREFKFGSDEHASTIEISHPNGNRFKTTNGFLIKQVSEQLETLICF